MTRLSAQQDNILAAISEAKIAWLRVKLTAHHRHAALADREIAESRALCDSLVRDAHNVSIPERRISLALMSTGSTSVVKQALARTADRPSPEGTTA